MSFIILSANGHQDRHAFADVVRDVVGYVGKRLAPRLPAGEGNRIVATGDHAGAAMLRHDVEMHDALRRFGLQPFDAR